MSSVNRLFTEQERIDIRTSYRQARDPKKQIKVLSELYVCNKSDIESVISDIKIQSQNTSSQSASTAAKSSRIKQTRREHTKHHWTATELEALDSLWASGVSAKELASHFNVSVPSIQSQIRRRKNAVNVDADSAKNFSAKADCDVESNFVSAIELLEEFQSVVSNAFSFNSIADVFTLGMTLGEFSCKVAKFLEEVKPDAK